MSENLCLKRPHDINAQVTYILRRYNSGRSRKIRNMKDWKYSNT